MMEFTYDGMVRCGFGFYNPNHAAALICLVMPFLWGWKLPWLGWSFSLPLTVALTLTYSRTGMLVLGFELAAYFILTKTKNWKLVCGSVCALLVIAGVCGVLARFSFDKAVTNRPEIWIAGIRLFAANPLGVGLGNSGMLASAFLLNGIECRTLVNSHLTLLAEFGIHIALAWSFLIVYALIRGTKKTSAWCAFGGMTLSAFSSSVFDWGILFDFYEYGKLSLLNFILSWLTLLLFLGVGIYLAWGKTNWQRPAIAGAITLMLILASFLFYSSDTPRIKGGFVIMPGEDMPLVLYDEEWRLKTVLPFLEDGYILPLQPGNHQYPAEQIYFFGNAAEWAGQFPDARLIFVFPPEFIEYPANTEKILPAGTFR